MANFLTRFAAFGFAVFCFFGAISPVFAEKTFNLMPPSPNDTLSIWISDCAGKAKFCQPTPLAQSLKMKIYDNGELGKISFAGCAFDSVMAYTVSNLFGQGTLGPYLLENWSVNGVMHTDTFQTIPDLVDLMNGWDTLGNWVWNPAQLLISGGHPGSGYTQMDVKVLLFNTPSMIGFNLGFDPKGTEFSLVRGFHEVVLVDTTTLSRDTFYVHVTCSETIEYAIQLGDTVEFCYDLTDILTAPASQLNFCDAPGGSVDFNLTASKLCIRAVGEQYGFEKSCWIVCDSTGFCDTTFFNVRVLYPGGTSTTNSTIPLGESMVFCFDTARLNAAVEIFTKCDAPQQQFVNFTLNQMTHCVTYFGQFIGGPDTACVVICDGIGVCDTMYFIVNVTSSNRVVRDTIFLGDDATWCVNQNLFRGDTITVTNNCQNSQGQAATIDINPVSLCLEISSLATGTDTACLVICDEFGGCDSVQYIITVLDRLIITPPVANPDQSSTLLAQPVTILVLNNDIIPSDTLPILIEILPATTVIGPFHGTVSVNPTTHEVIYTPDSTFCGDADVFMYRVCQNGVCDTALVSVIVNCTSDTSTTLEFFTGFSPNGDNVNDLFVIKNAEKYPNNDLLIFNRWGNQVFFQKNYRNSWDGQWNGKPLPDGQFYFIFNDGEGHRFANSVFVKR
jgi:gliding motility-associated-like protein